MLRSLRRFYHAHWQNLDEDRQGRAIGRGWRHGRAWLRLGRADARAYNRRYEFGTEWVLARRGHALLGLSGALGEGDSEDEAAGHVMLPGFSLFLHGRTPLTRLLCRRIPKSSRWGSGEREISVRVDMEGGLWWRLWADPTCWERGRPRWRDGHFDPRRFLFGRDRHTEETLEAREVLVPMPERAYPATARLFVSTWTHERFGWPRRRLVRCTIEIPGGIPEPGKGENAWDCEDDATFSWTGPAQTIPHGVAQLVESVLVTRERRGGRNWMPPAREAVPA